MADLITSLQSEANMIFKDRLVTDDEKNEFNTISKKYLKGGISEEVIFATKLRADGVYMEAVNYKTWCMDAEKLINQCLSEDENIFGEAGAEVCPELALFWPAIAKTTRGGVVACVSGAGAGRRAAARLAAASLPATLLVVDQEQHFNNQLKNAISSSAEGQRTLIVVGEGAVTSRCLGSLEAMRRAASLPTHLAPAQRSSHTEQNVKENLGIVLCVDKDREDLWKLFEKYPFMYNEGHVVWVEAWSSQTVREMPRAVVRRLIKENVHKDSNEVLATVPVEGFVSIYNSIESVVKRAPIRYFNFIHAYYHIACKKKETLLQRRDMLNSGVEALRRARAEVATLQEEAATQEALLSEKQAAANHALDQIGATVRANTDKKDEMHALKKNIELENEKLQIRKKEIEVELASVEPVIAAARSAVGDIRSESLSEIRSLRAPPDVVRDVLEGVLRLMGIADTSWHSMKNFLSKRGVKEDIRCLDASQISAEAAAAVRRLLSSRGASFQESTAKRASAACAPLAAWVRANLHYAEALARVAPLQAQQQQLHKSLREAEEQMAGLSSGLETVEQRVETLKAQLGQHTRDAAALELKLQNAADTLNAARHLLEQLAHEYTTWAHDLENISKEISELNVRSLLAAAYIVYLPELTEPQAREYLNKWSALITFEDSTFSVINFLSTPEIQLKWDADGLPADDTAVKNAVLIEQFVLGPRCGARPLIVDPEGEALTWLRRTLPTSRCDFLSQHSETLHTALQYAHRLGRVVVVTEIESATDVEALRCGVRLLLHTRDAELAARLQPHCAASLSVLHFTARLDGLTDQLVNYALQQQNPEMNEKSKEIKLQKATLQKQQHELQENVLRELCSNSDILKDSSLLASLEATRGTGATIEAALSEASAVEDARREACVAYRAAARAAAALALSARALYPAALPTDALLDVFADALASDPSANKSLQAESLNLNHNQIVQYTTKRIIERVLLSVHKKDKHIVALHLLRAVYGDVIKDQLWNIFLGNYDIEDDQNASIDLKKLSPWIKEEFVERIVQIKMTSEDLFNKLSVKDEKLWNEFQNISDANAFSCFKLSGFETVAAAAALRPDILYSVMLTFLETMLGAGALEASGAVAGAARWAARAMAPPRPILLLAAHGADLLAAHAHSSLNKVGVEAGREAWEACLESARGGGWLALEVGASSLTAQLQHFLQHYADRPVEDFSPDFRLWVVCEDREIPPLISNLCVNVIVEAGAGVRQNAVSTLCAWGPLEGDERMVRAHVALALLHATVQERRAYIPQGWSRWYAWEWGEVSACGRAVRALAARSGRGGGVDSEAARAISDALYAARVTGAWDRRVLSALVRRTLGEHVYAHAWRPPGCDVRVPYATRLQTCTAALATLPRDDSPALLALPRNCRRTWERAAADRLLAGLRKLESTLSVYRAAEGPTTAKTLPALWKKLMSGCPLLKGDYVVPEPEQLSSEVGCMWWQRVCADEAREAARTARFVHSAIAAMARRRIHIHQVPEEWQLLWSGPEAPEAYIKEFCFRARAACDRLPTNSTHGSLPQEVDLRSFLRPSRVLCALRAQCAVALRCAPHALALTAKWESNGVRGEGPALTALGLVVCGAEWREGALRAAAPHSPANSPAPPLLLTYALQDVETVQAHESLVVPMYESEARDQLLAESFAPLSADLPPEQALLNSIALVVAPLA